MRQLVRGEEVGRVVEERALVGEHAIGLRRRRGVLHPTEGEVGDGDLGVSRVGVRDADHAVEEIEHRGGLAEGALAVGFATRQRVVEHRDAVVRLDDLAERPRDHRHQIRRMRDALLVAEHGFAVALDALDELAVGQREDPARDPHGGGGRLLLGWMVETREPRARVGVLALRPDVLGLVLDEVHAASRMFELVVDSERERLTGGERCAERDLERRAGGAKAQRRALVRDGANAEVDRVEHQARDAVLDRAHGRRAARLQPRRLDVGAQVERDMPDFDRAVGAEVCARIRQREATTLAHQPVPPRTWKRKSITSSRFASRRRTPSAESAGRWAAGRHTR